VQSFRMVDCQFEFEMTDSQFESEWVKLSALGKYAFCQHFSPGVAHNGGACDCFAR
jgi:hypothetical protein